jgi:hypothetical protein
MCIRVYTKPYSENFILFRVGEIQPYFTWSSDKYINDINSAEDLSVMCMNDDEVE